MGVLSPQILEGYVAYKKSVLSYYNRLLKEHDLKSVRILVEALKDMDSKHKRHISSNKSMICPPCADFSSNLALTPIHEYPEVSRVFEEIISFKEKAIDEHLGELTEEVAKLIKATEADIHNQLRKDKMKYNV